MKRKDCMNFKFEDLVKYADLKSNALEAKRLSKLTENSFLQSLLSSYSTKFWNELHAWLDEEVENGSL